MIIVEDEGKKFDPVTGGEPEETEILPARFIVVEARTADLFKNNALTGNPYDSKVGAAWNLKSDIAKKFIDTIERKFANNNKFHGFFEPTSSHMSPVNLKNYISKKITFENMSLNFMANICIVANAPNRSGLAVGHVVFIHYKSNEPDDIGRLLVVMVGKQSGFDFDNNLQPVSLSSINTNDLRQAAMFDLTLFDEIFPTNDGEAYLKFILGKSKSSFFKEALGCVNYTPNADSVSQLNSAVSDFLASTVISRSNQLEVRKKISTHLSVAAKTHKAVTLTEIEHIIDQFLPPGSEKVGSFKSFVNSGTYIISATFEPTPSTAESDILVEASDPNGNFKYKMNLSSIGYASSKDDKPITVDDDLSYVTMPLTEEAKQKIKLVLGKVNESNS